VTHAQRGGYLFLPGFLPYDGIHGWMTRRMDGWMESFTKNEHDVLNYILNNVFYVQILPKGKKSENIMQPSQQAFL
jgi:hypothetical protein